MNGNLSVANSASVNGKMTGKAKGNARGVYAKGTITVSGSATISGEANAALSDGCSAYGVCAGGFAETCGASNTSDALLTTPCALKPTDQSKPVVIRVAAAAPSITDTPFVTDTTVTLPVSGDPNTYEYSEDGTTWSATREFTDLKPATQYTFYVRVKGTDTTVPSQKATITVCTAAKTPENIAATGTVSYTEETFTLNPGYEISTKNGTTVGETFTDGKKMPDDSGKVTLLPGTTYFIRKAATVSPAVPASAAIELVVPARPATPAAPMLDSKTDTTITITAVGGQEYSVDGGATWVSNADHGKITFTGLTANTTYNIITRVKAFTIVPGSEAFTSENSPASIITTKSAEQSKAAADPVDVIGDKIQSGNTEVDVKGADGKVTISATFMEDNAIRQTCESQVQVWEPAFLVQRILCGYSRKK